MIPISDENPTRRFPLITVLLMAANLLVFLYEVSLGTSINSWVLEHAVVPSRLLADPTSPAQIATIFSAMFMHAGWLHIAGNMLYLWIFGNNVEDAMGRFKFLAFYLSAGVIASVAQIAVAPDSSVPNLGASGAIAGALGAYLVLFPRAGITTLIPIFFFLEIARLPAYVVIGFWFVLQLGQGIASIDPSLAQRGGVAFFAHIGGFAAGVLLALPLLLSQRRRQARVRAY